MQYGACYRYLAAIVLLNGRALIVFFGIFFPEGEKYFAYPLLEPQFNFGEYALFLLKRRSEAELQGISRDIDKAI